MLSFDAKALLQAGLDESRRTIREQEPARPSTCLSTMLGANLTEIAKHRKAEPPRLIHLVRGDLDWIVMKCLEKDRGRRYETANGLAFDLLRHLNNEPVLARPPSRAYRFQKLARRNKLVFAAAAAVITVLAVGVLVSTWEAIRAIRAEREQTRLRKAAQRAQADETSLRQKAEAAEKKAETEAVRSEQVAQLMKDMLQGVGPKVALGRDTKLLHEILDNTAERVRRDLRGQPEVAAELLSTIGGTYRQLYDLTKAEPMEREALRLRRSLFGETNAATAASLNGLARVLINRRGPLDFAEAEGMTRQALAILKELAADDSGDAALSRYLLASALHNQGKLSEAATEYRKSLAIRRRLFGSEDKDVASTLDNLGALLADQGKLHEGEEAIREALTIQEKVFGEEHPDVADSLRCLANVLESQGRLSEAEGACRAALAMRQRLVGNDGPMVTDALLQLAGVCREEGKLEEARSLYLQVASGNSASAATAASALAVMYQNGKGAEKDLVEAAKWYRKAADQGDAYAKSILMAETPNSLMNSIIEAGRSTEAISLLQKTCESNPMDTINSLTLATWQTWFGQEADYDATRRRLVQQAEGTDNASKAEQAAKAYCARPSADATLLLKVLNLAQRSVELGESSPSLPWSQLALGLAEYRNGQYAAAEQTLTVAEQTAGELYDIPRIARFYRAMSLFRQERREEARKLFSQAEAKMPPLPADEHKPLVDGKMASRDVLICWLAYKEARALIEGPSAPVATPALPK
jgi:TPR repeat protein